MEYLKFSIDKIDESLIHKPTLLGSMEEWVLQVYKQFGFNTYEEVKAFALKYEKYGWMNLFYWSVQTEANFLKVILGLYKDKRKQKQVSEYYHEASLNWFPINGLKLWEDLHKRVKEDEEKEAFLKS